MAICPWVDHYIRTIWGDVRIDAHGPYDVSLADARDRASGRSGRGDARCRSLLARRVIFITAPHRPRGWNDAAPDLARWIAVQLHHVPAHIHYSRGGA